MQQTNPPLTTQSPPTTRPMTLATLMTQPLTTIPIRSQRKLQKKQKMLNRSKTPIWTMMTLRTQLTTPMLLMMRLTTRRLTTLPMTLAMLMKLKKIPLTSDLIREPD